MTDRADRVAGAALGLAVGDALGAGYEFGPPVTGPVGMIGGGPFAWEPGGTDDTQMAICILEHSRPGSIDLDAVGDRFIEWLDEASGVGNQTRRVLSGAKAGRQLTGIARRYHRDTRIGRQGTGRSCARVWWRSHSSATATASPLPRWRSPNPPRAGQGVVVGERSKATRGSNPSRSSRLARWA
jgi:hypothetical protein